MKARTTAVVSERRVEDAVREALGEEALEWCISSPERLILISVVALPPLLCEEAEEDEE